MPRIGTSLTTSSAATTRATRWATLGGFGAILLWSTTVAVARSLSEALGPLSAAAAVYCVGGLLALAGLGWRRGQLHESLRLPRRYLVGCGLLFTLYTLVLFLAVSLARTREQVPEVALLNYLWPALTLLFSLGLLGHRADRRLALGLPLALVGIGLVMTQGASLSWRTLAQNVAGNPAAYALGLAAGVSWALYSVLTRRWAGARSVGAVALFLPVTGVALLLVSLLAHEPRAWSPRAAIEAAALGAATCLAYQLWDRAMRRGQVVLVAAGSFLTPLLSTLVSCLYLRVTPAATLWLGCALLVAGSLLSWRSIAAPRSRADRPQP